MNSQKTRTNGRIGAAGFTLVEALVTIAVLTVIIAMGVPLYGQFTEGSTLTGRTSELVMSLNYARSEAVGRRAIIRVAAIDGDWSNGWEIHDDSAPTTLLKQVGYTGGVGLTITEAADLDEFTFDTQGRISELASFALCPPGEDPTGRELAISRFGRVEVSTLEDCR